MLRSFLCHILFVCTHPIVLGFLWLPESMVRFCYFVCLRIDVNFGRLYAIAYTNLKQAELPPFSFSSQGIYPKSFYPQRQIQEA